MKEREDGLWHSDVFPLTIYPSIINSVVPTDG
jgi:hypothetical protein